MNRKTLAIFMTVCLLLCLLSACTTGSGGDATDPSETPSPTPAETPSPSPEETPSPTPTPVPTPTPIPTVDVREINPDSKTQLLYIGRSALRIISADCTVLYIDPYAGEGYDVAADIILVTHQHDDHNQISLVPRKEDCVIISETEALEGGKHNTFSIKGIEIEAVTASNELHDPKYSVGYIITIDGIKIYAAGDTDKTGQMGTFAEEEIDYAFLPCDGKYNMGPVQAAACAEIIGAKHNIPYHTSGDASFSMSNAEAFNAPNSRIIEPGEMIELTK